MRDADLKFIYIGQFSGLLGRAADLFAEHGILQNGFLMLGGPGETRETVEESLAFADSLPLATLQITLGIRLYPGTDLAETALQDGIITPEDDLLPPRFYLKPELADWLDETVARWAAQRPHWRV